MVVAGKGKGVGVGAKGWGLGVGVIEKGVRRRGKGEEAMTGSLHRGGSRARRRKGAEERVRKEREKIVAAGWVVVDCGKKSEARCSRVSLSPAYSLSLFSRNLCRQTIRPKSLELITHKLTQNVYKITDK